MFLQRRKMNARVGVEPNIDNVADDLLLRMEGRWYLAYSGCPLWQKPEINTVSFNFHPRHLGEELVLEDRVEYIKNGKMRFRLGFDYPVEGIFNTFRWKGKGVNRTFRNHFEVTLITEDFMVLFFEKTLTSPTSIDILTRERLAGKDLMERIFDQIRNNETISAYLKDVRQVRQTQQL